MITSGEIEELKTKYAVELRGTTDAVRRMADVVDPERVPPALGVAAALALAAATAPAMAYPTADRNVELGVEVVLPRCLIDAAEGVLRYAREELGVDCVELLTAQLALERLADAADEQETA